NVVGLKGVGVARGLSDKGYIYTDRPAYRAGQIVHLRGCLRHAADDAYTIEKDKKYTVEVFDGRNRLVRQQEIELSQFGSFHAHFVLPATSPQGQYRVLVRDEDGKNYQGTFPVHEYQLEPVHLVIDTPRNVYYRGEEIEGTIKAAYYYGAPLAGREIRYKLAASDPDNAGRLHTATTDEKGEVKFKLPTREFAETQVLPLVVALPERNLQTAVNFVLAAQGFSIGVGTIRPVYVAGETFEATVTAKDAEGKPAGRKLSLKVLEQTTVEGKVGERLVEEHELETAEKDGLVRQTLKLEKGGRYVLRAEGSDRFKNPISGQYVVQISDDEDQVRLRILADAHTFKVGDTAAVKLHWREDAALALVAFQGARVLDYRLVELKKGANDLKIPMTAKLAPNFELAVAVMTDPRDEKRDDKPLRRFHTASSPFTVQRDLRVQIAVHKAATGGRADEPGKGPVRPGEEVEVTITTTDPQGKPVAAELSLAMVEQSLLERFPWQVAAIQDFFRGTPRQPAVRTTSSITFAYNPSTCAINPRLLAERDRLEVEAEEEASRVAALTGVPRDALVAVLDEPAAPPAPGEQPELAVYPIDNADRKAVLKVMQTLTAGQSDVRLSLDPKTGSLVALAPPSQHAGVIRPTLERYAASLGGGRAGGMGGLGYAASAPQGGQARGQVVLGRRFNRTRASGEGQQVEYFFDNGAVNLADQREDLLDVNVNGGTLNVTGGTWQVAANADNLNALVNNNFSQLTILDGGGVMQQFDIDADDRWDRRSAEAVAAELTKAGAVLLPALRWQETGYWNPAVVTGEDGKATVTIAMPERSTAWKFMAKGITAETLAGEATDEL
ncbi:MAG: MG2 domain-containing protein, partial [Planctomycetota bacterium]